ncbi:AFI_G0049500.mRNA.1.CDS.1 [Saccharomyces cerevisiae]|nr:AFI_G0049500.mRNA.1.CDS.1 [Saccharomyces cerevisiae]CAI6882931.1 AFI_G0049500.mRNA.1.CDS.1 [Saccharomyces cerevisiae]
MFNRFNKLQAALALVLYSQSALGQYYTNSSSIASNSSTAVSLTSSGSVSISSSIVESTSSTPDVSSSLTQLTSSSDVSSSIASSSSPGSGVSSSVTQSSSSGSSPSGTGSTATTPSGTTPSGTGSTATTPSGTSPSGTGSTATGPSGTGSTATTPSGTGSTTTSPSGSGPSESGSSASITQSVSSAPSLSSSIPQSTSSASTASGSITSGTLSSITSSASSATATASNSLSSSDGTIYLPSTTISGDLTLTGSVIATEAVEIAAGGKLTLLDGDKYVFSADLIVHGDLSVEKSKPTYPGTEFDITGENFDVSGTFNAEEPAASSASTYSFTPGSFINSGGISLSLSASPKGEVTFSPYSNSGTFTLSNSNINGGSVSGLQRRAESAGSVNGEINLDNGSTYAIGNGTINIVSGNLTLPYPDAFIGQTVVLNGEGVLVVDPTETIATLIPVLIPVVGYTGENQIAITENVTALSYDGTTGVLTATLVLASVSPKELLQVPMFTT